MCPDVFLFRWSRRYLEIWGAGQPGRTPIGQLEDTTHAELCKEGPLNEPANVFGAISIKAELVNEFVL